MKVNCVKRCRTRAWLEQDETGGMIFRAFLMKFPEFFGSMNRKQRNKYVLVCQP